MASKEFLTTGEVSEILNISRSTVSRKFDRGIFHGKKHPITGERLISRESLAAFMAQFDLPLKELAFERKRVLLNTADRRLAAIVNKVLAGDERVETKSVEYGGDALVQCSKQAPDLLIIDEEISDIPSVEVIKSLRRSEEQRGLRIICAQRKCDEAQVKAWGADHCFDKAVPDEKAVSEKLYSLLGLPEEAPAVDQPFEHHRHWPRIPLNMGARIRVYPLRRVRHRLPGEAVVENISRGGAYLSGIRLEAGEMPVEPFRILLEVDEPPLENWRAHCQVVRLCSNGSLTAGVRFVNLSKPNLKKLTAVAGR